MTFLKPAIPSIGVVVLRIATIWLGMSLLVNASKRLSAQDVSARWLASPQDHEADRLQSPRLRRTFFRFLMVYAVGFVVILAILVGLDLAAQGALNSVGVGGGVEGATDGHPAIRVIAILFSLLDTPISLLLSVLFASAVARAINGLPARPTVKSGPIWIYALLSWAVWWVPAGPSEALVAGGVADYAAAFLAVFLQTVIYGATVLSAAMPDASSDARSPIEPNFNIFASKRKLLNNSLGQPARPEPLARKSHRLARDKAFFQKFLRLHD
ncbi:MAG: hypothetical protein ACRDIU_05275 [Actinomycetota bacterium]